MYSQMRVIKRNGKFEEMKFDKVTERIRKLSGDLNVSPDLVSQKVLADIRDGIKTSDIDDISADICISMMSENYDYEKLASRILISNLQKSCPKTFSAAMNQLGLSYKNGLNKLIQPKRDYDFDYFGIKTLMKMYLMKDRNGKIVETPQYMFMRVAMAVSQDESCIQETYDALSMKMYIHASPTLFNAGSNCQQMSSCYLVSMKDDSMAGIYDTKKECALISKYAGGIGLHIHNIRAKGSYIRGTNGTSDGIIPMLRTINSDARYSNQSGRRKGSYAIYLEPWHADVMDFLELRLNQGDEEARCRDLFTALWVPDLFMKRLERNENWSLFCPNEAPGLSDVYGDEFETLYTHYETKGLARESVPIQKIWLAILKSQVETGTPYILYKDHCNKKSNQKNLGVIKSSNLCVAPETWVKTRNGNKIIMLLENQEVEVWNGHEWSKVTVRKTSLSSTLMTIEVNIGGYIKNISCTPEHKFILFDGTRVNAENLKTGNQLLTWTDDVGTTFETRVTRVSPINRFSSTYCFTEPLRNQAVFNGILTGQCAEIVEYSDAENTAVCNLASMALPSFVQGSEFNFEKFESIVALAVRNLNAVIDKNMYPVETAEVSNFKTRPIALGVQGLADVFQIIGIPFDSMEARELNKNIFEHMYFAALQESCKLSQKYGSYEDFSKSPAADGILQFDLWGVTPSDSRWTALKENIKLHGLRNSLLIGLMPTASTSQILGFNECFEPFTTNIYMRRTLAGEFMVLNKYLVNDLQKIGLWSRVIKDAIIRNNGSVQNIPEIPQRIKDLYKTVWEIGPRVTIDMARDRGAFVCQSQSMNLFVEDPTNSKLSSIHMYAWKQGLKTGMYYLRTRPKTKAQQVTIEPCVMCSA